MYIVQVLQGDRWMTLSGFAQAHNGEKTERLAELCCRYREAELGLETEAEASEFIGLLRNEVKTLSGRIIRAVEANTL